MHKKNLLSYAAAGKVLISVPFASASEPITVPITISTSGNGKMGNGKSSAPSISADGRFVAFQSTSTDLVDGDTNEAQDIFVHDQESGNTTLVSISSSGKQGNNGSHSPSISADGRYITFASDASNLDGNDLAYSTDIFVHDRVTGMTTRVSQEGLEPQGKTTPDSAAPAISADGRYITYASGLSHLVADDTNDAKDIFVYDRLTNTTTRINTNSSGNQASGDSFQPSISADGRYITYSSDATNLVSDDSNEVRDIFVHDRGKDNTSLVSINSSGKQGNDNSYSPSISNDGRYITYSSFATNLVSDDNNEAADIFVHDRTEKQTSLVSITSSGKQGNDNSLSPSISNDGRYITYISRATNLVSNDKNDFNDIFIYDHQKHSTTRVNLGDLGIEANENSYSPPSISAHGNYISFGSIATNLVSVGDHTDTNDIFIRSLLNPLEPTNGYIESFEVTAWPEHWYSYGWRQNSSSSSDGTYSLKANSTGDNKTAVTEWHINIASRGKLSFDMKVDSEQDFDFFRFYIDDALQAEYSGFIDWAQYQYTLTDGEHKLRFEYAKDINDNSGADTAWIDNIQFTNDSQEQLQADFIERFYLNILGRSSDAGGLTFWLDNIQSTSATFVALAFFNSNEFHALQLNDSDFVNALYNTALGRNADQGGLDFWLGQIDDGLLRNFVVYGFLQSAEFARLAEQSGVTAYSESDHTHFLVIDFVRRFYVNVLERQPEQGGMDFWSERLFSGQSSASDIALGFFFSNEFINQNHDDSTFIDIAYQTILSRAAEEGGKKFWIKQLATGLTRYELIQAFIVSHEFEMLASSYGIRVQ